MHDGSWMGWMMLWMGLAFLVFLAGLALLAALVALAVRWASGLGRGAAGDPALQEARMRLARGEIGPEEYDRIVAKLRENGRRP